MEQQAATSAPDRPTRDPPRTGPAPTGRRRAGPAAPRLAAILALVVALAPASLAASPAEAEQIGSGADPAASLCAFTLGFRTLDEMIPNVVGGCLEDEHYNPLDVQPTEGPRTPRPPFVRGNPTPGATPRHEPPRDGRRQWERGDR